MILNCRFCQKEFDPSGTRQLSCSKRCANLFRYRNPKNSIPALKYRGANYRNFLMSLRTKSKTQRDLSIDFLCKLYEEQKGICSISGREMTFITGKGFVSTNLSIDRIDPSLGYTEDNVRLVCRHANTMKLRFSDSELFHWCRDICDTLNDKRKRK